VRGFGGIVCALNHSAVTQLRNCIREDGRIASLILKSGDCFAYKKFADHLSSYLYPPNGNPSYAERSA
jgi:hypothetical protein